MTKDLSRKVSVLIDRLMDERGVTGYAIWKATGIPQTSISRKRRELAFDMDDVQKIAPLFGTDATDLISQAERGVPNPPE